MNFNYFGIIDIGSGLLWLGILYGIAYKVRNRNKDKAHYRYYIPNLSFKIFFALVYGLFYIKTAGGGDTVAYFETAKSLNKLFIENPTGWWEQMMEGPDWERFNRLFTGLNRPPGWIYREEPSLFVSKVLSFVALITFHSYWATTFIMAFMVSKVTWRLYEWALWLKLHKENWLAYGVLFMPSLSFWCAGVSKDTLVFISTLMVMHYLFLLLQGGGKNRIKNLTILAFYGFLILHTRNFFLMAIIAPAVLAIITRYLKRMGAQGYTIFTSYVVMLGAGTVLFLSAMGGQSEDEALESSSFLQEAKVVQDDFAQNQTYGNSRYSLGEVTFSPVGIVKVMPLAIVAGIFYPMPWNALSPTLLFNGLESLLVIILFIGFITRNPMGKLRIISSHEILIYCLVIVILIGFMAGFTSILYGVLVRIRAPLIPFLMIILTLRVDSETQEEKIGIENNT